MYSTVCVSQNKLETDGTIFILFVYVCVSVFVCGDAVAIQTEQKMQPCLCCPSLDG